MNQKLHRTLAVIALLGGLTAAVADTPVAPPAAAAAPATQPAGDPTGTWTWSLTRGGKTSTYTLTLNFKDGKLDGTLKNGETETKISDASYSGGQIAFSVSRESKGGGKKAKAEDKGADANAAPAAATPAPADDKPAAPAAPMVTKFTGTLSGDTITGVMDRPGKNGKTRSSDWTATRSK